MSSETRTTKIRLRRGRPRPEIGPCDVQLLVGSEWRPCEERALHVLATGKAVCPTCLTTAKAQRLPWADTVTGERIRAVNARARRDRAPPRPHSGKYRAAMPEEARAARWVFQTIMEEAGMVRPADLEAARQAVKTGDSPPWAFVELAALLETPGGRVYQADVSKAWKGERTLSDRWTFRGKRLVDRDGGPTYDLAAARAVARTS